MTIILMVVSAIGGGVLVYAAFKNGVLSVKSKQLLDDGK